MSNSQEQSLDEDAVFQPLTEACPQFMHSESERYALECLLNEGPGAFYMQLNAERLGPFLSPEEVNQMGAWAHDYRVSQVVLEEDMMLVGGAAGDPSATVVDGDGKGEGGQGAMLQDFSARYFPVHSDTPAPPLELGWPERESWDCMGQARVYTSPPQEAAPPIREVVRKLIQGAKKVVGIVTDRLSDSAVIGDLHAVASLGIPVYIILNQRTVEENFTPHRLRHPNIRVRIMGGKTFCTRDGKTVEGELKENFLLVDLEKVMVGSYSLTWMDAHLHRQLVMVMSGPVVESFDREFRILYAASLPIPDTWKAGRPPCLDMTPVSKHQRPENLDMSGVKPLPAESYLSPPPAYADQVIDWEALGLVPTVPESPILAPGGLPLGITVGEGPMPYREPIFEEPMQLEEKPIQPQAMVPHANLAARGENRTSPNVAPGNLWKEDQATFRPVRRLSMQSDEDRQHLNKLSASQERLWSPKCVFPNPLSPTSPRDSSLRRNSVNEDVKPDSRANSRSGNAKRPLILRVPQRENFTALSDILRKLQGKQSTPKRGPKAAVSDISRSMMDLSTSHGTQSNCFDGKSETPAQALMKQRFDDKSFTRPPKSFLPSIRPRSSSFAWNTDWRSPPKADE